MISVLNIVDPNLKMYVGTSREYENAIKEMLFQSENDKNYDLMDFLDIYVHKRYVTNVLDNNSNELKLFVN